MSENDTDNDIVTDADTDTESPTTISDRSLKVILSVLAVLLLVAVVVLSLQVRHEQKARDDRTAARSQALAAARLTILDLDALSVSTIDADFARVLANATGTFRTQFSNSQAELKQIVVANKTVSVGSLVSSGVVSATANKAVVLVAVDRTLSDKTDTKGTVAHDRWQVTLVRSGSRWLVSDLEPVT